MKREMYIKAILAIVAITISACDLSVGPQASLMPQQLLFVAYGPHIRQGIYSLQSDGVSIRRLTPDSLSVSTHYSCSPDGETILFSAYYNLNSDIWRISRSSKSVTRVITDPSIEESPQWLQDGSGFVFRSNRSGRYSIWACDPNGLNIRQLVADTAWTSWPVASPRRSMIAFSFYLEHLIVLDYAQVRQFEISSRTNSSAFAWSPSGETLAFEVGHDLYTWDLAGSLQKRWTDNNIIYDPSWSPDASQIAFNAYDTLKVLILSTREARRLMTGMAYGGRSAWSPDGHTIAVEAQNPPRIVLVDARRGSYTEIPPGENAAVAPQWVNATW